MSLNPCHYQFKILATVNLYYHTPLCNVAQFIFVIISYQQQHLSIININIIFKCNITVQHSTMIAKTTLQGIKQIARLSLRAKILTCSLLLNMPNFCLSQQSKPSNKLLKTYQKIKQSQNDSIATKLQNSSSQPQSALQKLQKIHPHLHSHAKLLCSGCNVTLQSKDSNKYGYIDQKILKEAIEQNQKQIKTGYGEKVRNRDAVVLDFLHQVQKQSGVKIFNQKNSDMQNLDNIQVLLRLQQKIDKYQQQNQLLKKSKQFRKQLLCFRCFSLRHHNRLPQQYDNNENFTTDSTQFILNKIFNRHKGNQLQNLSVEYLYMIDAYDILGTFQLWLFKRLYEKIADGQQVAIVVNKIDIINKEYIYQIGLQTAVKARLKQFIKAIQSSNQNFSQKHLKQAMEKIKIYYISCNSRDGLKKLKQNIQKSGSNVQLIGFPNTGKTTLLNILSRIKKSTSRVPGTTIKISEHKFGTSNKIKVYDMPGLHNESMLYSLISKPSQKTLLTWHKRIAPGLLTNQAIIYGGKIQIPDVRIIVFGLGGACQANNKWFVQHYKEFWVGLPDPSQLHIVKHEIQLQFVNGVAKDLQISGYGFIGFRLAIPNIKRTTRKLTLYLPKKVQFGFRQSILSKNDSIFHNKSGLTKKFMLQRLDIKQKQNKKQKEDKKIVKQETKQQQKIANDVGQAEQEPKIIYHLQMLQPRQDSK